MAVKESIEEQLKTLMEWVTLELAEGRVPRVIDVVEYALKTRGYTKLTRARIAGALRLHPSYMMNSSQQRQRKRSRKHRSVTVNSLGTLHADIGFFTLSRDYSTPKTYQAGYLIAKDVLSRYTYGVIIKKNRTAPSMVRAFTTLLEQHQRAFPGGHRIQSISFDRETSVMSKLVQTFFKENFIQFHAFQHTSSKAKFAESSIRQLRTTIKRLLLSHPEERWWTIFDRAIQALNQQPIVIRGIKLPWRPIDINQSNVNDFLDQLYKKIPVQLHTQSPIAPGVVKNFSFNVGDYVRTKKIITSSALIGEKRSEISLDPDIFVVTDTLAYLTSASTINKAYICENVRTRETEVFDEHDVAKTTAPQQ